MSFSIHDVKTIFESKNLGQAKTMIKSGWVLLSAGFDSGESGSCPVYILGNVNEDAALDVPKGGKLDNALNES